MAPTRKNYSNYKYGAVGSRLNVWRGDAHHTSGGLTKTDLMENSNGKIVSRRMSKRAKLMYKRNGLYPRTAEEMEDMRSRKQGYKDRKDESIAMRVRKPRTAAQLRASRDESYGRFGSAAKKSGKINRYHATIFN